MKRQIRVKRRYWVIGVIGASIIFSILWFIVYPIYYFNHHASFSGVGLLTTYEEAARIEKEEIVLEGEGGYWIDLDDEFSLSFSDHGLFKDKVNQIMSRTKGHSLFDFVIGETFTEDMMQRYGFKSREGYEHTYKMSKGCVEATIVVDHRDQKIYMIMIRISIRNFYNFTVY
jgi:hypothetical protein